MLEKDIERKCCEWVLRTHNVINIKQNVTGHRGVPDRLFIAPSGLHFWVEFKRPGGLTTLLQTRFIEMLRSRNVKAFVINDFEVFKRTVNEILSNSDD